MALVMDASLGSMWTEKLSSKDYLYSKEFLVES